MSSSAAAIAAAATTTTTTTTTTTAAMMGVVAQHVLRPAWPQRGAHDEQSLDCSRRPKEPEVNSNSEDALDGGGGGGSGTCHLAYSSSSSGSDNYYKPQFFSNGDYNCCTGSGALPVGAKTHHCGSVVSAARLVALISAGLSLVMLSAAGMADGAALPGADALQRLTSGATNEPQAKPAAAHLSQLELPRVASLNPQLEAYIKGADLETLVLDLLEVMEARNKQQQQLESPELKLKQRPPEVSSSSYTSSTSSSLPKQPIGSLDDHSSAKSAAPQATPQQKPPALSLSSPSVSEAASVSALSSISFIPLADDSESAEPKTALLLRRLSKRSGISDQRLAEIQMIRALKKQLEKASKMTTSDTNSTGAQEGAS